MNKEKFKEIIKERVRISEECYDEWDEGIKKCWNQEIDILIEDIPSTIIFLQNECTADEFSWISEVIEDIAEITNSHEFIDCYKNLMKKFPEESQKYNISGSIEYAEAALREEGRDV
jgi:hypothetical protein